MYGCLITPNNRNQGVLLEYSVTGGITWNLLMEIFYDQYSKPGFVFYFILSLLTSMIIKDSWSDLPVNLSQGPKGTSTLLISKGCFQD